MHRAPEAVDDYLRGFNLAPNDMNLIALGVQCLWDERVISKVDNPEADDKKIVPAPDADASTKLTALGIEHTGSWLTYIVDDTLRNGAANNGVNPKYRPRGYNEGPKKDE